MGCHIPRTPEEIGKWDEDGHVGAQGLLLVSEISHFSFNCSLPTKGGEFYNIVVEWKNGCVCVCVCVCVDFLPSLSCIILETKSKVRNFALFVLEFFCETSHSWDSLDLIVPTHSVDKGGSWT